MRAKIQGVVIMDVDVLANGTVDPRHIRVTRSLDPGLGSRGRDRRAAVEIRPSMRLGQPVASRVTIELSFTLR
jgi:hypothetical protein